MLIIGFAVHIQENLEDELVKEALKAVCRMGFSDH